MLFVTTYDYILKSSLAQTVPSLVMSREMRACFHLIVAIILYTIYLHIRISYTKTKWAAEPKTKKVNKSFNTQFEVAFLLESNDF